MQIAVTLLLFTVQFYVVVAAAVFSCLDPKRCRWVMYGSKLQACLVTGFQTAMPATGLAPWTASHQSD